MSLMEIINIKEFIDPHLLDDNHYTVKDHGYRHRLNGGELFDYKTRIQELLRDMYKKQDLLSDIKNIFMNGGSASDDIIDGITSLDGMGIKAINAEIRRISEIVYQEWEFKIVKCYLVDYQPEGVMAFYNEDGYLVDQRDLYPNERQLSITGQADKNQDNGQG